MNEKEQVNEGYVIIESVTVGNARFVIGENQMCIRDRRYYTHITEKMSDAAENALTAAFRFD